MQTFYLLVFYQPLPIKFPRFQTIYSLDKFVFTNIFLNKIDVRLSEKNSFLYSYLNFLANSMYSLFWSSDKPSLSLPYYLILMINLLNPSSNSFSSSNICLTLSKFTLIGRFLCILFGFFFLIIISKSIEIIKHWRSCFNLFLALTLRRILLLDILDFLDYWIKVIV